MDKVIIGFLVLYVLWFGWRPADAAGLEGHWAGKEIESLVKQNILVGKANGAIDPDGGVRRGEFVAVLARALRLDVTLSEKRMFSDVGDSHWAVGYVEAAARKGIVGGVGDERMGVDALLTREEAFTMLGRCYGMLGLVPASDIENPYTYLYGFKDYWKVSAWAKPSVGMGVKLGLIAGDAQGRLMPGATMTRAEMAVLVVRVLGKVAGN
jgi:hypothetical protein